MTRTFDLITALVSTWQGLSGFGAPGTNGTVVFDGPGETADSPLRWVVVGGRDFVDPDDDLSATVDAEWISVPIGAGSRYETITVPCAAGVWTGDAPGGFPDWAGMRADLETLLAAITVPLITTNGLGLQMSSLLINAGTYKQTFDGQGARAVHEFDVEAKFTL